jgi:peptide/nickel transport system substrate-binding protein
MKKITILTVGILVLLMSACKANTALVEPTQANPVEASADLVTEPAATETVEVEPTTKPELADEVVIGVGRNLYYGNSSWEIIHMSLNVWEPLVYVDENLNPVPVLAESWSANDDMTEWTITIREGIVFHDGTPFTAQIAADNIQAAHENYTPLATLDHIEAINDTQLIIYLTAPTPALMNLLAGYSSAQLSPASFEQTESEVPVPYGTGPYKFESYDGEKITLVRNDEYYGELAITPTIIYHYIPDANTRILALQSGEIDAIADVGSIIPSQGALLSEDENINLLTQDVTTTHYIFFNNDKEPLNQVALRQAISMAINRDVLVQEAVYGYGEPAAGMITQLASSWQNPESKPVYDLEQAKELAASVLGDKRITLSFVISSSLSNRWPYAEIAQIMQAQLAEIGVDLDIVTVEGGTWSEMLANDEYDISIRPFTLSSGDPDDFMSYWVRENGTFNKDYSISYQDAEVQALVEAAISETDAAMRKEAYDNIQLILSEQVPFSPIYHEQTLFATRSNVFDLSMDESFKPTLATVYKLK